MTWIWHGKVGNVGKLPRFIESCSKKWWSTQATTTRIKGFLAYMANREVNSWWKWRYLSRSLDVILMKSGCWRVLVGPVFAVARYRDCCWHVPHLRLCREKNLLFEKFRGEQFLSGPVYRLGLTWSSLEPQASSGNTVPSHPGALLGNAVEIVKSTFTALVSLALQRKWGKSCPSICCFEIITDKVAIQ